MEACGANTPAPFATLPKPLPNMAPIRHNRHWLNLRGKSRLGKRQTHSDTVITPLGDHVKLAHPENAMLVELGKRFRKGGERARGPR